MNVIYEQPIFSKVHDDELLFIELFKGDPLLMTKGEFLQSNEWNNDWCNIRNVSIATSEVMSFDLKEIINQIGEDAYEDWTEHVWDSIKDAPETKTFLEMITNVFNSHKVYYAGRSILIDKLPTYKGE